MDTIVFSLKQKKETQEFHLFRAKPTVDSKCTPESKSICKEMDLSESSERIFSCEKEAAARRKCAEIGRQVCGTCVSSLYETYS